MIILSGVLTQYYAVICANILSVIYGMSIGWPSISLPLLQSDESPLASGPITLLEVSWIGSIVCIGGIIGTVFFGWLVNKLGRKYTHLLSSGPLIIGWLLIEFGQEVYLLLIGRFLNGFAGSAVFVTVPLIVSEISEKENRGILGSLMILSMDIGILLAYVFCAYTSYRTVPWIVIGLTVVSIIGFSIVPETPKFLMISNKTEQAIESLKHFRGDLNISNTELIKYSDELGGTSESTEITRSLKDFCEPATKKAIVIAVILMNISIFAGSFTLANYFETLFRDAGGSLSPEVSSIIVAAIQILGTYSATMTIERAGRKMLIVVSGYLASLCLIILGVYILLKEKEIDVSSFDWVPLLCVSLLVFIAANGALPVPFVVIGEIFKQNVRGALISFSMLFNWGALFLALLVFPYMIVYLKFYGTLWFFSAVEVSLITAILVLMPETKGLSIEQIVTILKK